MTSKSESERISELEGRVERLLNELRDSRADNSRIIAELDSLQRKLSRAKTAAPGNGGGGIDPSTFIRSVTEARTEGKQTVLDVIHAVSGIFGAQQALYLEGFKEARKLTQEIQDEIHDQFEDDEPDDDGLSQIADLAAGVGVEALKEYQLRKAAGNVVGIKPAPPSAPVTPPGLEGDGDE